MVEWQAFYLMEPWGFQTHDYHVGLVCSTLANLQRTKNVKPFTPSDFMQKPVKPKPKAQSVESQIALFKKIQSQQNG
ncbi:phage tail assembly protein T [Litoribrevibacter albus]|uniref:phage tail assembly protein T n=1 Tax=Litoribrevibacter albus TaxID=1473156 RepID=UPI003D68BD2B